jgi:microsomal dipeptidase-like Zn-dependent dipeptidase
VTLKGLREGRVNVVLSVLYSFFDELELAEVYPAQPKRGYLDSLLGQVELVEQDLADNHRSTAVAVHTPGALAEALGGERVAFIHCVEGGFHLGSTTTEVDEAVSTLARRGVAYVTLAHLLWRHVARTPTRCPSCRTGSTGGSFPSPTRVSRSSAAPRSVPCCARASWSTSHT